PGRKPAEFGDAVLGFGQLPYADKIVLCSNSFSNPGDRSRRVVVTSRGRSGKTVRYKLRTTHGVRLDHASSDFGMRREQPKFSVTESKGCAMAAWRSRHRRVDRGATRGLARSSDSKAKRVRSNSRRS